MLITKCAINNKGIGIIAAIFIILIVLSHNTEKLYETEKNRWQKTEGYSPEE